MKIFRTFSHLNGAEYLLVRKPTLRREIIDMLSECRRSALADHGNRSINQFLQDVDQKFARRAQRLGWLNTPRGFERERVAMSFCAGSAVESFSLEQIFGSWLCAYSIGNIDVGVKILPVEAGRRDPRCAAGQEKSLVSFKDMVGEIQRLGRNTPLVPLFLIGLSLPR